jgi:hypothetical protein
MVRLIRLTLFAAPGLIYLALALICSLRPAAADRPTTTPMQMNGMRAHSSAVAGLRLSVEYDYIHQDELRSGTRKVDSVPDGNELERETLNPAAGTPLDASLQPGTGSTDIIVGAYYYKAVSQNFDVIANAQFQSAVKHHLDQPDNDYRPGNSTTVSLGLRDEGNPALVPQLQVNLLHRSRDQGVLADIESTAGNVAYISPGLTARAIAHLHAFGFVR